MYILTAKLLQKSEMRKDIVIDHVADYRALPAFVLNQIVIKHDQNIVGMEEFARIVDNAHAVGISVGGDTDVALSVYHVILQASQRKCGRRRQFSSEQPPRRGCRLR